jgi:hypothetical protein
MKFTIERIRRKQSSTFFAFGQCSVLRAIGSFGRRYGDNHQGKSREKESAFMKCPYCESKGAEVNGRNIAEGSSIRASVCCKNQACIAYKPPSIPGPQKPREKTRLEKLRESIVNGGFLPHLQAFRK